MAMTMATTIQLTATEYTATTIQLTVTDQAEKAFPLKGICNFANMLLPIAYKLCIDGGQPQYRLCLTDGYVRTGLKAMAPRNVPPPFEGFPPLTFYWNCIDIDDPNVICIHDEERAEFEAAGKDVGNTYATLPYMPS